MNAANDHLSILHISDLHCEEGDKTNLMLEQLVSDLHDQDLPAIKHIVISGDLANRAKAAEYKLAAEFTLKLLESLSLGPDDVTVVPGNHDVDYGASQRAYEMNWSKTYNEKDPAIIPMPGVGHFFRDDEKYKERFRNWSREFYAKIIGAEYPLEADQQYCVTVKGAVVFLALNSAWEVDHHYEKRMSINGDALAHGLNVVRGKNGLGPNLLKIAVWHHPISGPQSMSDDFVNLLVQNGFSIGLHGDVHHSVKGYKELDDVRGLRVIGAGTHASAAKQMPPGTPREYHTIVIDLQNRRARVNSRYRSDQQGAWRPNAIYGTKDQPLAWYEFGF